MPLEINEIDIAMRVSADGYGDVRQAVSEEQTETDKEELIRECVRRVLQALKAQREP